ncbi:MAG TPA: sulfatase, partial [Verrucomicrobiales bacterium]|nr:sulfatase [Verrucomicrobiales bacterium]
IPGRPSMGSWLLYGLGADTDELPGFVVMTSSGGGQDQPIAARQWHSGFLPSRFQGVKFNSKGD